MTSFQELNDLFFEKIEEDGDFFYYYNLTSSESMQIANERAETYMFQAIAKFWQKCEPEIDIYDYDKDTKTFNFDLTEQEVDVLTNLMIEAYFKARKAKLRAFEIQFTPSDLKVFSPNEDRKTFMEMYQDLKVENEIMMDNYSGKDRMTGASKTIDYTQYSSYITEE